MRLKNLTIKGFKSFANETSLNFNDDVIGVVGPNGSGKSNVVDAIRWVLGEQKSKELRLEKMSDIIFNGTKKRKEAATAQVTLTFDNDKGLLPSEYQTLSISRILYRSGESEYRLNGVVCRLKDISTLLMDTGIGSNSYAIIALGMVDDILADKENARRRMFEQAAGVSKYKRRKQETLGKLKGTSDDLDRVEDLLFEIENNLKALEKQAKRAQKYLDLKAEYKELSIAYAQISIHSLKEEYKRLGNELKTEQDKYSGIDAEIRKQEALLEKEKKSNVEKEISLTSSQKVLSELIGNIRQQESERSLAEQKKKFKESNVETLKNSTSTNKNDQEKLDVEIQLLKQKIKLEEVTYKNIFDDLQVLKKKYEVIALDHTDAKKAHDLRGAKREELSRRNFEIEKQIALLKNNETNINADLSRTQQILDNQKSDYSTAKDNFNALVESITQKDSNLAKLVKAEDIRKQNLINQEKKKEEIQAELISVTRTLDSKKNEYDLLKSMIDNFEGFPESIKFLNTSWNKEAIILSDILDVDDSYKGIIEQYLAPYLNYYIVDSIKEAQTAIKLLAESQNGKANFFLLDQIEDYESSNEGIPDTVLALSKVEVEDKYRKLLKFILKDVLIYNGELDGLSKLVLPENKTYLASNGSFLKGANYISGGSVGLFEGKKIGRKKNLEKLSKSMASLNEQKTKLQADLDGIVKEINGLKISHKESDIITLQKERNKLENEKAVLQAKIDQYKLNKKAFKDKEEEAAKALKNIARQLEELKQNLKSSQKEIEHLIQETKGEADLDYLNKILSEANQKYNDTNINSIRQQNLISNLQKDLEFKQARSSELGVKINQEKQRRKFEEGEIEEIGKNLEAFRVALIDLYSQKKQKEDQLSEVEQKYFSARSIINEIEEEVRKFNRAQNQIQLKVQQIRDLHTDVKFKINSVGERLKIEFNIEINDIINLEPQGDASEEALMEQVEKLKSRLANYGDVNPMAVEAYNEMHERYETISTQRKDILEAKESLMQTIKEIEETAVELFLGAFNQVRLNFIEVFRSLFSEEDTCDLILLDESNPLESEIEIVAKPKGKKPKSLSQLSGGEKTLTATALLFALYLLKPAPFCIFDEVDAPLDDANIQKFNKIIKKFSKDSQFIIVTHNKSTMTAVDVLYGVYMQETGVSSVTPVDFRSMGDVDELQLVG